MGGTAPDIDAVTAILQETARELVLPRFGRLAAAEVERKVTIGDAADIVTIVDREVEARLTRALGALTPGAAVIGEEAVHARPELLHALQADGPAWLIDPIDGTKNFARGDDRFGVIVAWVVGGRARAGWILLPARDQLFVAESGAGAFWNGARVTAPAGPPGELARGTLYLRYMPPALAASVAGAARGRFQAAPDVGSAAVGYTEILRGAAEFAVYHRLLPWDHAAPALILTEGGGRVAHLDGRPYSVRSAHQVTIVAQNDGVLEQVRGWL